MSSAEDGNGSTVKQKSDQAVRGEVQVQPAARENRMENPSNVERGFSVNHGMNAENVHGINTNIECIDNVQELIAETGEINEDMGPKIMLVGQSNTGEINEDKGPRIMLAGQSNTELNERADKGMIRSGNIEGLSDFPVESSEHVDSNSNTTLNKNGPNNFGPKGTWTQINRMEFGLGGPTKPITLPALGKRNTHAVQEEQMDVQDTKRSDVVQQAFLKHNKSLISLPLDTICQFLHLLLCRVRSLHRRSICYYGN
nr:hypothetical protein CFP56_43459 [Quercus suber]